MSQIGINWCIAKGAIPIPGAKNIKQAQEKIAAEDWQLDKATRIAGYRVKYVLPSC